MIESYCRPNAAEVTSEPNSQANDRILRVSVNRRGFLCGLLMVSMPRRESDGRET